MTEETSNTIVITKLVTAYRVNFPLDEKSKLVYKPLETPGNCNFKTEGFDLTDIPTSFKITEKNAATSSGWDKMMWDKSFIKLRPPSKTSKVKSLHPGVKFLSRTCEEIVDIIRPFTKSDGQENNERRQKVEACRRNLQSHSPCFERDDNDSEIRIHSNDAHVEKLIAILK